MYTLSKVPWRMVLERLLWRVAFPNNVRFRLLAVATVMRRRQIDTRSTCWIPTGHETLSYGVIKFGLVADTGVKEEVSVVQQCLVMDRGLHTADSVTLVLRRWGFVLAMSFRSVPGFVSLVRVTPGIGSLGAKTNCFLSPVYHRELYQG